MQRATDITILAFKAAFATLREGMTQYELGGQHDGRAHAGSAASDPWALVGFGKYSAFPHGSVQPQRLERGDIVLLDAGCAVRGLPVGHHAHDRVRPADAAADRDLEPGAKGPGRRVRRGPGGRPLRGGRCRRPQGDHRRAGSGPDYRVPGLPHRTGHGIGLDGHEWTYFVRGNTTPIAPGCASATSRRSPSTASSASGWRTVSTSPRRAPVLLDAEPGDRPAAGVRRPLTGRPGALYRYADL